MCFQQTAGVKVLLFSTRQPGVECLFQVRKDVIEVNKMKKGDVNNDLDVQREYLLQFGHYRGQSLRWMLENDLVGWFVENITK